MEELMSDEVAAEITRLRAALIAVDKLWTQDARLGFEQEMSPPSPVGLVWKQVREALRER
jgi:hypothetical protein